MNAVETPWAAGLFEGEGTVYLSSRVARGKRYPRALLRVYSTDRDVIEKLHLIVGCGRVYGPYMRAPRSGEAIRSRKPISYWDLANDAQVFRIGRAFSSWLGVRRRAALEPALAFCLRRICKRIVHQGQPQRDGNVLVPGEAWQHLITALGEE